MRRATRAAFLFSMPLLGLAQVTTVVAGGPWVFPASANGGPAIDAPLISIHGVAVDSVGNVFAADSGNNLVVKVTPAGVLTIAAKASGPSGLTPQAVALDSSGSLYFTDDNRVRKVTRDGIIQTVAGNGSHFYYGSGDGGPATDAYLNSPHSLAFDAAGNLYIAANEGIRKVDTNGIISTVVKAYGSQSFGAQLGTPEAIALDEKGTLFASDLHNYRVWRADASGGLIPVAGNGQYGFSGDGGPATSAQLQVPGCIAVDPSGNLYIGDYDRIRKVTPQGVISTIAQLNGRRMVGRDSSGNFYLADSSSGQLFRMAVSGGITLVAGSGSQRFFGDGGPATSAQLWVPNGLAFDRAGNLYIADGLNNRIREVTANGVIQTVAGNGQPGSSGDGGPAMSAQLNNPQGIALDEAGDLYIAEAANHRVRKVTPDGKILTAAGNGMPGYSGDGSPATQAQLNAPTGIAVDRATGDLYIADSLNFRVRKVTPDGRISTVAGLGREGFSGDGGPAVAAQLEAPSAVAVDTARNLYIVDSGVLGGWPFSNQRVRKVDANGIITTIAGNGVDGYSGDGAAATSAELCYPQGVAVDAAGNVYILDSGNDAIRRVDPGGTISTVSINPPVVSVNLSAHDYLKAAGAIAVDTAGSVYISDAWNYRILKVTGPSGPYFVSASVVNAASLNSASGVLAPGGLVSIFGENLAEGTASAFPPLPSSLLDTTLTIGGLAAPLLFVSPGQINALVPFEAPLGTIPVTVTRKHTGVAGLSLAVSPVAPGIFTLGKSQGAILTSTGEVAGPGASIAGVPARTARRGEYISIFATGLGDVTNRPAGGAPPSNGPPYSETILMPMVTIGGVAANPTFSGLAPSFSGLYQINVQIPETAATGAAVQVTLRIGGVVSNTVTMAVQ